MQICTCKSLAARIGLAKTVQNMRQNHFKTTIIYMTDHEKIDLLLNSQTGENNFIAMRLMLDVLGLSFEEAFLRLQLREEAACRFSIEIADIRIFFVVNLYAAIEVPPHWGYLRRDILIAGEIQKQWHKDIYIDEGVAWRLNTYDDERVQDIAVLKNDIRAVIPIVKQLFFERYPAV